jgi:hypothetical protein
MLTHLRIMLAIPVLSSCATVDRAWELREVGCVQNSLSDALEFPEATDLWPTDIRIGQSSSDGERIAVQFLRHFNRGARAGKLPTVLVAVGNAHRSCVAEVQQQSCPFAESAYHRLANLALPVGHRFDEPTGIVSLDGVVFYLAAADGEGNETYWSYYGQEHPAASAIEGVLEGMQACIAPVREQLVEYGN